MLNRSVKFSVVLTLLFAAQVFAADMQMKIERAAKVGDFVVGVGSDIRIESNDSKVSVSGVFVGKAIHPDGTHTFHMVLNKEDNKIYFIEASHFSSKASNIQTILNPFEQAGGTCTGYAMYDYLQQLKLSGFNGSGVLNNKLSTEKGRTTLLVDNINEYYLTPQHQYSIKGILNKYGKDFGFKCNTYKSDSYEKIHDRILSNLNAGMPVMISFNLGPDMYKSPFGLKMYDQSKVKMDDRLWIPRKTGERNSGGHTIVIAASFEHNNKTYLVVIDSDWSEPRVWDMESFLNDRTAIDEVEITSCG